MQEKSYLSYLLYKRTRKVSQCIADFQPLSQGNRLSKIIKNIGGDAEDLMKACKRELSLLDL